MANDTRSNSYTEKLLTPQTIWWKKILNVQLPYRFHLRGLKPGFILDIGCGIGRNLDHVQGHGVGIDHNLQSLEIARQRGFEVFTPEEFSKNEKKFTERFDSLLLSHILEHMSVEQGEALVATYLGFLKPGGMIIVITPQEAGFASDDTHVEFIDHQQVKNMANHLQLSEVKAPYSFPFPRAIGKIFKYNEFVSILRKPT